MNVVARVHFKITDTTLNAELAETAEPINLGDFCGLCVDRREFCNVLSCIGDCCVTNDSMTKCLDDQVHRRE